MSKAPIRKGGKAKSAEAVDVVEFEQGEQVEHPAWGVGTVIKKEGTGDKQKLLVLFAEEGQKKIKVAFAKLKKVT